MTGRAADFDVRRLSEMHDALPPAGDHPAEDEWVRFADEALSPADRDRLADHVVSCDVCAVTYRAVMTLREGHNARRDASIGSVTSTKAPGRNWPVSWLAAAAVLVAAIGTAVVRFGGPAPADIPAPIASAPLARREAPPAPEPRLWARVIEAPAVDLPADLVLATRGTGSAKAFLEAFGLAIAPYRSGRYDEAARLLSGVAAQYPDIPEAAYYLGVSRILSSDFSGARAPLEVARSVATLSAAARWFAAVAAERSGDAASADRILAELCASPGDFQARACAAQTQGR